VISRLLAHLKINDFGDIVIHQAIWVVLATLVRTVEGVDSDEAMWLLIKHGRLLIDYAKQPPQAVDEDMGKNIYSTISFQAFPFPPFLLCASLALTLSALGKISHLFGQRRTADTTTK